MFIVIILFIILFLLLSFVNNYTKIYIESFKSNISSDCKPNAKSYNATCDKKKIYNILSELETDISKIKYNVIREKTKSANYDFDKMYIWYKNKLRDDNASKTNNKKAAAAYANKVNSQIENDLKKFDKKNKGKFEKDAQKKINSVKAFKLG